MSNVSTGQAQPRPDQLVEELVDLCDREELIRSAGQRFRGPVGIVSIATGSPGGGLGDVTRRPDHVSNLGAVREQGALLVTFSDRS